MAAKISPPAGSSKDMGLHREHTLKAGNRIVCSLLVVFVTGPSWTCRAYSHCTAMHVAPPLSLVSHWYPPTSK